MQRTLETYEQHLRYVVDNCGRKWIVLRYDDVLGTSYMLRPAACKSNYCTRCRQQRLRQLRQALLHSMRRYSWRLVTLTFEQRHTDPLTLLKSLRKTLDKFFKRMRRRYPSVIYIRTIEIHRSGYPHVHLVVNRYIPRAFLQVAWSQVGGGRTDIRARRKDGKRVTRYSYKAAARYLTCEIDKVAQDPYQLKSIMWLSGVRSISTSRNIKLIIPSSPWSFEAVCDNLEQAWYYVDRLQHKARWGEGPPVGVLETGYAVFVGPGYRDNQPPPLPDDETIPF